MSQPRTILLLNGSPKCERSNSRLIAKFLVEKLEEKGLTSEEFFAARLLSSSENREKLLKSVDDADLIILATPLYVDSVPSFTIKAMETIREHQKNVNDAGTKLLIAVMNSGFPEKEHMSIALKIVQNFARESNLRWAGGITVGMGGALGQKPLKDGGGMTAKLTEGLSLASAALARGEPIPEEAEDLASKPFMPIFLTRSYLRTFGNRMWDKDAKNNGARAEMRARPYQIL
jgi:multimeric flavodoxin WrbA